MLLTAAWAGSVAIGKCDLNAYDEAIEGSGYGKISCNRQVAIIIQNEQCFHTTYSMQLQNVHKTQSLNF